MDAKQWRRMLCSYHFKVKSLEAYTARRLLALDKSAGSEELQVRPIGVGEVMRRIVGKTIAWCSGVLEMTFKKQQVPFRSHLD